MKGKKYDSQFVSSFIAKCIQNNVLTPDEMLLSARVEIQTIDNEIKRTALLKIQRSKLLDVIAAFDKQGKDKTEEAKSLSFFDLKNPNICKLICDCLKNDDLCLSSFNPDLYREDVYFCIKQLVEYQIINKSGQIISRGEKYNEYMKLVFHEEP